MIRTTRPLFRKPIAEILESRRLLAGQIYTQQGTSTDFGAKYTAVADFNEDGHLDVATANHSFGLSVRLGTGDGTFIPTPIRTTATIPAEANALEKADFNRDGHTDIVLLDKTGYAYVFLGDGTGHLALGFNTLVGFAGTYEGHIEVGDLNHDSSPDLVLSGYDRAEIKTLLGVGDGTFGAVTTIPIPSLQLNFDLADINADGHLDLVLCVEPTPLFQNTPMVTLLRGKGDGEFEAPTYPGIPAPVMVNAIEVADLNHDGWKDLVMSSATRLSILGGIGPGTFLSPGNLTPPPWSTGDYRLSLTLTNANFGIVGHESILIEDLDGNGYEDVVFGNMWSNANVVLNSGVIGRMTRSTTLVTGPLNSHGLVGGDFDEDGALDLVWTNDYTSSIGMVKGRSNGTFAAATVSTVVDTIMISADFNSDGRDDVLTSATGATRVYLSAPDGSAALAFTYTHPTLTSALAARTGDFNGDGVTDFALLRAGTLTLFVGQNNGTFTSTTPIAFGASTDTELTVADLNADDRDDLVSASGGFVAFGSAGAFSTPFVATAVPAGYTVAAMADMNGDGKDDRVLKHGDAVEIAYGGGDGSFGTPALIYTSVQTLDGVAVADFDQDGSIDITLTVRLGARTLGQSVLLNRASGFVSGASFEAAMDYTFKGADVQDVNADGFPDVVCYTTSAEGASVGAMYLSVLLGNRFGGFAERIVLASASGIPLFGDFNGDGAIDYRTRGMSTFTITSPYLFLNQQPPDRTAPTVTSTAANFANDNRVVFTLSEPVRRSGAPSSGIELLNLTTGQTLVLTSYVIASDGRTVTAAVPLSAAPGDYRVRLPQGSVEDLAGNPLAQPYDLSGPSLFWMPGDITRDRAVNFDDLLILAQNYGQTGRTFSQGNVDYSADGLVGFDDLLLLAQRYGTSLFSSAPVAKRSAAKGRAAELVS